jgi:AAA+ superfamily predicted ATPase
MVSIPKLAKRLFSSEGKDIIWDEVTDIPGKLVNSLSNNMISIDNKDFINSLKTSVLVSGLNVGRSTLVSITSRLNEEERVHKMVPINHTDQTKILTRYVEYIKETSDSLCMSLLLYGMPGTGKTFFANIAAKECHNADIPYFYYRINSYSNMSYFDEDTWEREDENDKSVLIVVVDEIDRLIQTAPDSQQGQDKVDPEKELRKFLDKLNEIDKNILVIATTNHVEDISPQVKRSGRFDLKIKVNPWSPEVTAKYLEKNGLKLTNDVPSVNGGYLASDIQAWIKYNRLSNIASCDGVKLNIGNPYQEQEAERNQKKITRRKSTRKTANKKEID